MISRYTRAGLLLVLILLTLAGVWLLADNPEDAELGGQPPSADQARLGDATSIPVAPVAMTVLRNNFQPFRTAPEPLPEVVTKTMRKPSYGANWDLAQRLDVSLSRRIWALPGNGYVCLVDLSSDGGVGQTCSRAKNALRRGIATTTLTDEQSGSQGKRLIIGLVPDRSSKVRIGTPGFPAATVSVANNVFVLRDTVTEPPEAVNQLP